MRTEWTHAYTAMGLTLQHALQGTNLARTYNMDVAACFVRAIGDILGCGVRANAIGAANDEKGEALRREFLGALHAQGVQLVPDRWELSLEDFQAGDPKVRAAAEATSLEECFPFVEALLGPNVAHLLAPLRATP